jgi:hypothetical protein
MKKVYFYVWEQMEIKLCLEDNANIKMIIKNMRNNISDYLINIKMLIFSVLLNLSKKPLGNNLKSKLNQIFYILIPKLQIKMQDF